MEALTLAAQILGPVALLAGAIAWCLTWLQKRRELQLKHRELDLRERELSHKELTGGR